VVEPAPPSATTNQTEPTHTTPSPSSERRGQSPPNQDALMINTITKHLHVTTAILSGLLLFWRGGRALLGYSNNGFAYRVLPHLIDTILLASALYLAYLSHQYPFVQAWLTAKIIVLFAYIFFGYMAVKKAKGFFGKLRYLLLALASFVYIIGTAHYKNWLWLTRYF